MATDRPLLHLSRHDLAVLANSGDSEALAEWRLREDPPRAQPWLTFGSAVQALVDAGYDRQWARQVVDRAEVAGVATGRRYEVESNDRGLFKVTTH